MNFFNVLVNRMDNILDSELAWRDFLIDTLGPDGAGNSRYIRINPDLKDKVPPLFAKEQLRSLQGLTISHLATRGCRRTIRGIAHRLVASSFYFEKSTPKEIPFLESYTCTGDLRCRFEQGAPDIRELGRYLKTKQTQDFQPYFLIRDSGDKNYELRVILSPQKLDTMTDRATFNLDSQNINVSSRNASTEISLCFAQDAEPDVSIFCVSGFPRKLVIEDNLRDKRIERRRTAANANRRPLRLAATAPSVVHAANSTELKHKGIFFENFAVRLREPKANHSPNASPKVSPLINLMDDEPLRSPSLSGIDVINKSGFSPLMPDTQDERLTRPRSAPNTGLLSLSPGTNLSRHSNGTINNHQIGLPGKVALAQEIENDSDGKEELSLRPGNDHHDGYLEGQNFTVDNQDPSDARVNGVTEQSGDLLVWGSVEDVM